MTTSSTGKICGICHKDVSNSKRVKDAQGNYYCAACHEAANKQAPVVGVVASVVKAAEVSAVRQKAPSPQPTPAKKTQTLPKECPNCGAPVFPNRRLCIKCHRDVTQMDRIIAMKAQAAKGPTGEEKLAIWIGRIVRFGIWTAVIVFVVLSGWAIKLWFTPSGPFDHYPTTRVAAVKEFLGYVSDGSDKALDKAFLLVSFRVRTTSNPNEQAYYNSAYRKMHEDFGQKYGTDWLSKATVERPDGSNEGDEGLMIKINNDSYYVSTQVQIAVDDAIIARLSRGPQNTYAEDGKNHFGILEVEEYPAHPRPKEPIKPEPRTDMFDHNPNGGGGPAW
jgi:hypothetical protein